MRHQTIRFALWLEVEGKTTPLSQVSVAFERNRIPQAQVSLPVGYALPGLTPSPAMALGHNTVGPIPAKICMSAKPISGTDPRAQAPESERIVLFDGDITGLGYKHARGGFQLIARLTHWLAALNYASAISTQSHPSNPAKFMFDGNLNIQLTPRNPAARPHYVTTTRYQVLVSDANIRNDLWGQGILPILQELVSQPRLNLTNVRTLANDTVGEDCKAALARFLTAADGDKFTLPVDIDAVSIASVADAIRSDLAGYDEDSQMHFQGMANTTIWEWLLGYLHSAYMFSIVPFPGSAGVVPFVPGLRDVWNPTADQYTITQRDHDFRDISGEIIRPLRATGVYAEVGNLTGGDLSIPPARDVAFGGLFPPADVINKDDRPQNKGVIRLLRAPRWLSGMVMPYRSTELPRADATNPDAADEEPSDAVKTSRTARSEANQVIQHVAHTHYANEVFAGRQGQIAGPVRFDICPGSTISISGVKNDQANDITGVRYGSVLRTEMVFDADSDPPQATTNFVLGYVHTQEEHDDEYLCVERHPLYGSTFPGHHLIEL